MLERLQAAAAERERAHEATRRFVADAGHELRTPLATMGANLETLARNPGLPERQRRDMLAETLVDQRRMTTLTEALQALTRGEAGALGDEWPVDLGELVAAAVAAARTRHPHATIRIRGQDVPFAVTGSPTGLRLLIDNLLETAARHAGQDRAPTIEVAVEGRGGRARIVVDDDGPGIPPAERSLVLERFHRGSTGAPSGSGLGLSLVAQQAARHDGGVRIDDAPLGGTRVEVTLGRTT